MKIMGILEQGVSRPALLSATGSYSATNQSSRSVSITPPAGTSMLVALLIQAGTGTPGTPQFNSVNMAVGKAWENLSNNRLAIYYLLNPTVGVAQNLTMSASGSWAFSFMRGLCLSGAGSIGSGDYFESSSSGSDYQTTLNITLAANAFIAGLSKFDDNGGTPTVGLTNLTLDLSQYPTEDNSYLDSVYNASPGIGAQAFTWDIPAWDSFPITTARQAMALDIYG